MIRTILVSALLAGTAGTTMAADLVEQVPSAPEAVIEQTQVYSWDGAYLGIYHAGAEWGWWLGPADCGGNAPAVADVDDLLGQLDNIRVVSCTAASWRLLGLSFAGWNAVVSIFLVAVAMWGAFRPLAEEPAEVARSRA